MLVSVAGRDTVSNLRKEAKANKNENGLKDEEINNLLEELDKFGLIEFVKSSRIAIIKSSEGVHKKVLDMEKNDPTKLPINNEFLNHKSIIFEM